MKYKFSLNEKVKGIVEWELEHYNESKRELETAKDDMMPTMIQSISGMPGSHEASRQTEQVALKITTSASSTALKRAYTLLIAYWANWTIQTNSLWLLCTGKRHITSLGRGKE